MLLRVESLRAGYGEAVVLEDVGFTLDAGQCLAVLGRNGVGKSTLMLTLMGATRQRGGTVRWQGRNLAGVPTPERSRAGLGWVPQERDIFRSLSVEENLLVVQRPGEINLASVYELFPRLRERRRNPGDKLSGGEQQMLAIGRTLMTNPRLLLLDEPFEGLAPVIVDELEDSFRRLRARYGFAVVIVEQHAEDTLRLSDHAIVLERGRVVERGSSAELLADFGRVRRFISVGEAA